MKKITTLILSVMLTILSFAQNQVVLNNNKTNAEIMQNTEQNLVFNSNLEGFFITEAKTLDGVYNRIVVPNYYPDNIIGNPELPVLTKLIEIPLNCDIQISIISYDEQIINLNEYGAQLPLVPNQASLFKNQDPKDVPFEKNEAIYSDLEYYSTDLIKIDLLSKMRGIQVAQLTVSPFSYDIETNVLTVKNNIEVEVSFKNSDLVKTTELKTSKYSPAFEAAYHRLWNYKEPAQKDALSQYPIKYVIISDRMFEDALAPFITWKTLKGFTVDIAYTDDIGTTTTDIKSYIEALYTAGTVEDPAPTYLLLVGDVAQVPTFSGSGHKTDMYYCEFDGGGDYIPEMYFGRFSATNVAQLLPQIEKTLMFEEYTFPDPSYLAEVVLVAGDDGTFGPTHANGQINYAHNYYFNAAHDITDYTYLYPDAGSSASDIISDISEGVAFVNYTAHCGETGWAGPSFTTSDIPGLANSDEYFFSIGNCCQSNTFDSDECFGEALLRAEKKGAVIHIGGSNNTLWDEDFYWSVGLSTSISATTSYEQSEQAVYDHMFHENSEDPYFSAYQMVYIGNMAVSASTSTSKQYYWEIYHVMGDPSLMPYAGVPDEVTATYLSSMSIGMSSLTVSTEVDAYVAISIDGVLLDAKLANSSGEAILIFDPLTSVATAKVVVTKQFRAPHIGEVMIVPNDNDYDAMLQTINVPISEIHISEATLTPEVTILNLGQINLTEVTVGYSLNGSTAVEIDWSGNLATLATDVVTFPEITIPSGENTFVAYVNAPNGETDEYPENDEATKDVLVYAGNVKITSAESPETILCNSNSFEPSVIIKNVDSYNLTSATISYSCGAINDDYDWTGDLAENASTTITFPENTFPTGNNTITYTISSVNGGSNIATSGATIDVEFLVISNGEMIVIDLLTDTYSDETSWEVTDNETSNVLYSEDSFSDNEHHITEMCLGGGCYTFTIYDSYGDGMGGSLWEPDDGSVLITNTSTSEEILNFNGGADEWAEHSVEFCIDAISCPLDIDMDISDAAFELSGGLPIGGTYTGVGVTDNIFDPAVAGVGNHTITYHYTFEGAAEEQICEFIISITASGINTTNISKVEIYPNPSKGMLYVSSNRKISNIELYNYTGQLINTISINNFSSDIELLGIS